jgi:hypothetical protein
LDLLLYLLAFFVHPVFNFPQTADLEEKETEGIGVALIGFVVDEMHLLSVSSKQFRGKVVRSPNYGHFFCVVAKSYGCACSDIANFEVERVF